MPTQTIENWENDRFRRETQVSLDTLPLVDKLPTRALELGLHGPEPEPVERRILNERCTAGIAVKLLWEPVTGETFVSVVWGEQNETFQVPNVRALEAFYHPFVSGCSIRELRVAEADDEDEEGEA